MVIASSYCSQLKLSLRTMEDFINTLFRLMAGPLQSLDYSCISTRAKTVDNNTQVSETPNRCEKMNEMKGLGLPAHQLLEQVFAKAWGADTPRRI
ncbi:hypothetical protein CE463_00545 (plasmid) [Aeromonas salmonicida]|nr:hypothetical protein CE463_00545 [Aeromonas salmonicida]